jgi:hypothetical protein
MAHRAYRGAHQRTRAKLLPAAIGTPCPICGLTMHAWMALDLDHSNPEDKQRGLPGDRIVCAKCNRSRGGGPTLVAPKNHTPSRNW